MTALTVQDCQTKIESKLLEKEHEGEEWKGSMWREERCLFGEKNAVQKKKAESLDSSVA